MDNFDFDKRAEEKRQSRLADERALASGSKSLESLIAENEVLAPLADECRIDLAASESLS